MKIRIICVLTAALLFALPRISAAAEQTEQQPPGEPEGAMLIAENENLSLYADLSTAEVAVADRKSNRRWYSNPILHTDDETASEALRAEQMSQISVTFLEEIRNVVTVNSYTGSVSENSYSISRVRSGGRVVGLKITYDFREESQRFKIPLQITLGDEYLEAKLLFDEIEEYGTAMVCSVDLLGSFGAGLKTQDGYLFVPDGSGALIRFSDSYREAPAYRKPVYGRDYSMDLLLKNDRQGQQIRLPVFGVKQNDAAFLAVIESGDALAAVKASSNERMSDYSAVNAQFAFRETDEAGIAGKNTLKRTVRMADARPASVSPAVRYYFLSGADASYSGMARRYQRYLVEKYGLKKQTEASFSPLSFEVFGRTEKRSHFLGVPVNKAVTATTLDEYAAMLDALRKENITGVTSVLYGFQSGGYQKYNPSKIKYDGKTGGNAAYGRLLRKADGAVYTACDLIRDYCSVDSWFKGEKFIRSLNGLTVKSERGTLSAGAWNGSPGWLIASGHRVRRLADQLLSAGPDKIGAGIAFEHMGEALYNNFSPKRPEDRQQIRDIFADTLRRARKEHGSAAAESGGEYLLAGADYLYEVPLESSGHLIFSEDVPFFAMALHGYVRLASEPVASAADPGRLLLRCIETGVSPLYRVTGAASGELSETVLRFLYNTKFADWKGDIVRSAEAYGRVQRDLWGQAVTEHEKRGGLSVTTYENGAKIAVNYTAGPISYEDKTIEPHNAYLISGGNGR